MHKKSCKLVDKKSKCKVNTANLVSAFVVLQHDNEWHSQAVGCLDYHEGYESYESWLYIGRVVLESSAQA